MRIRTRIAWIAMVLFCGLPVYGQDTYGVKLNPGERLVAINGVPVEQLGIRPDGTRQGTNPSDHGGVVTASAVSSSSDGMVRTAVATNIVGNLVANGQPFSHTPGDTVMDKVNHERRLNGMGPLTPDPELMELALRKATIAAQRRYKNHIGGSIGSARAEGVGHTQGRFLSCCLDMPATYGGAAMVQGADGWYCCLLVR